MLSLPAANSPHGQSDRNAPPIPQARISALGVEHDDLDSAIDALIKANTLDGLIIARLKKRKLKIRDEIAGLLAAVSLQNAATPNRAIAVFQSGAGIDATVPFATGMVTPAPKEVSHG